MKKLALVVAFLTAAFAAQALPMPSGGDSEELTQIMPPQSVVGGHVKMLIFVLADMAKQEYVTVMHDLRDPERKIIMEMRWDQDKHPVAAWLDTSFSASEIPAGTYVEVKPTPQNIEEAYAIIAIALGLNPMTEAHE